MRLEPVRVEIDGGGRHRAPLTASGEVALGSFAMGIDLDRDPTAAVWRVTNRGDEAVAVRQVALVWRLVDARPPVRMLRNGWQSWSPTDVVTVGEAEDPSRAAGSLAFVRDIHGADPGVANEGELRSDLVTVLRDGGGATVLVGFLGGSEHDGTVRVVPTSDSGVEVRAEATLGGAVVVPGEERPLHPVAITPGDEPSALLEGWADQFGENAKARTGAAFQVGWCSWYHYFHRITESAFRDNLARAADWPFDVFQLDDGYQAAIGDWLATDDSFPSGVEGIAQAVGDTGMTPGIWLAPFLAAPESELAQRKPKMLASQPDSDEPLVAMFNQEWGGFMYGLDTTHRRTQRWLAGLAKDLVEAGYRYLKLDFTFAPAVQGTFADEGATPAQRVRLGYEAIRRGAGEDTFILACGCPLGPAVGVVDGMRIGPDVAPSWRRPPDADVLAGYEEAAPSTRSAWRSTLARSFMHRRLWLNDPDCLMLRTRETDLTPAEARAWALAVGVSGGMALVSDDLSLLGPDERRHLDEVIALGRTADEAARSGPPPRCTDLLDADFPTRLESAAGTLVLSPDESSATLTPPPTDRSRG